MVFKHKPNPPNHEYLNIGKIKKHLNIFKEINESIFWKMFSGRIFSLKSDQLPRGRSWREGLGRKHNVFTRLTFYIRNGEGIQEMGNRCRDGGF